MFKLRVIHDYQTYMNIKLAMFKRSTLSVKYKILELFSRRTTDLL